MSERKGYLIPAPDELNVRLVGTWKLLGGLEDRRSMRPISTSGDT